MARRKTTPFADENGIYHIVYRTHNTINWKEYTGKHSTDKPLIDGYYGSGTALEKAVDKYGLDKFVVEVLSYHETSDLAFAEEELIVDDEYVDRDDVYNEKFGGIGGWDHSIGKVVVKDKDGTTHWVDVNDERYLSGELVSIMSGHTVVIDKSGNKFQVEVHDERLLSGELGYYTQ